MYKGKLKMFISLLTPLSLPLANEKKRRKFMRKKMSPYQFKFSISSGLIKKSSVKVANGWFCGESKISNIGFEHRASFYSKILIFWTFIKFKIFKTFTKARVDHTKPRTLNFQTVPTKRLYWSPESTFSMNIPQSYPDSTTVIAYACFSILLHHGTM